MNMTKCNKWIHYLFIFKVKGKFTVILAYLLTFKCIASAEAWLLEHTVGMANGMKKGKAVLGNSIDAPDSNEGANWNVPSLSKLTMKTCKLLELLGCLTVVAGLTMIKARLMDLWIIYVLLHVRDVTQNAWWHQGVMKTLASARELGIEEDIQVTHPTAILLSLIDLLTCKKLWSHQYFERTSSITFNRKLSLR